MMKLSVRKQLLSFSYAFTGIKQFISSQHNAWIQVSVALLVILAGFLFSLNPMEWCTVLFCIGLVLALEAVNTSLEELADALHPEIHEGIRKVKDIAAGAVLIAALTAIIIGLIIFVPHLLEMC
jgi:diacylglycerol kinase (ATP)